MFRPVTGVGSYVLGAKVDGEYPSIQRTSPPPKQEARSKEASSSCLEGRRRVVSSRFEQVLHYNSALILVCWCGAVWTSEVGGTTGGFDR